MIKILDFYADWCGPCKRQTPILEELETEFDGRIKVEKIDVEEDTPEVKIHLITSIPTLVFLNENNEVIEKLIGFHSKAALSALIEKHSQDE